MSKSRYTKTGKMLEVFMDQHSDYIVPYMKHSLENLADEVETENETLNKMVEELKEMKSSLEVLVSDLKNELQYKEWEIQVYENQINGMG